MIGLVTGLGGLLLVLALGLLAARAGLRTGDQPGDVTVTVTLAVASQPDGPRPVAAVAVHNPGRVPVLVGLSVRAGRLPAWPGGGMSVSAPARTTRPRLLPGRQEVLGVAGAGATARWLVPVPARGRRYRLIAVAGQDGRRLRVIRLPVPARPVTAAAGAPASRQAGRGC